MLTLSLQLSKYQIVGNHISGLICMAGSRLSGRVSIKNVHYIYVKYTNLWLDTLLIVPGYQRGNATGFGYSKK